MSVIGNQGFISAANLAVSFYLIRVIGVESFGVYAVCFAIAYGINAVLNSLISLPLVSTASAKSEGVRTSMIRSSGLAIGGMFLAITLVSIIGEVVLSLWIETSYPISLIAVFGVSLGAVEFGRRQFFLVGDRAGAWKIDLTRFTLVFLSFALVYASSWRPDPFVYVFCFLAANIVSVGVFVLPGFFRGGAYPGRRKFWNEALYVARHGRWLSLSTVLQLLSDQAVLLLVAALSGNFAAGVVRTCQMIVGVVNPVLMSLENILPKRLGELLRARGSAAALRKFWLEALVLLGGIYALLGCVFLFSPQILSFVTKGDLEGYASLLRLFCVIWALYPLKAVLAVILRSRLKMKRILSADAAATFLALPASYVLILEFGAYGAAIGMIVSQVCAVLLLAALVFRRERDA